MSDSSGHGERSYPDFSGPTNDAGKDTSGNDQLIANLEHDLEQAESNGSDSNSSGSSDESE
jgi:hypothetical protein